MSLNTSMPIAVYLCLDSEGTPRYVGKTKEVKVRTRTHKREKPWFCCLLILQWTTETEYKKIECAWITYFRSLGFPLENKNNGGGGPARGKVGRKCTEEGRERMRLAWKTRPRMMSEEQKQVIGNANKGRKRSAEWCRRNGDVHRGKTVSKETRTKISRAVKKEWETDWSGRSESLRRTK